jgi:hypothetical protein
MAKKISATEVNKFCYCRLQWYYERLYGARQLSEWRRERNAEMGWAAEGESSLERGRKFHDGYARRRAVSTILRRIAAVAALAVVLYFLLKYANV